MIRKILLYVSLLILSSCTVANVDFSNSIYNSLQLNFTKDSTHSDNQKINLNQNFQIAYLSNDSTKEELIVKLDYQVTSPAGYSIDQVLESYEKEITLSSFSKTFSLNFKIKSELPFSENPTITVHLSSPNNAINFSPSSLSFEIDNAPFVTLTSTHNYINSSNQSNFLFTGSCSTEGESISLEVDGTQTGSSALCTNGAWSLTMDFAALSESNHIIKSLLNLGPGKTVSSSDFNVIKDVTAPDVSSLIINDTIFSNQSLNSPIITWSGALDALSGINLYQISIGTAAGLDDVLSWQNSSSLSFYQATGLSLVDGKNYYVNLRVIDNAGNSSAGVSSDGWLIDLLNPNSPNDFTDGMIAFSETLAPKLIWNHSSDVLSPFGNSSGITKYQISIGDSSGGNNILDWLDIGYVTNIIPSGLSLTGNKRYFANIRAIDNAGNISSVFQGDGWWNLGINKFAIDSSSPPPRGASSQANFGHSVAISEDQSTMVIGAPYEDFDQSGNNYMNNAGAVYVYVYSAGSWVLQQKLIPSGTNARNANDSFGSSVDISNDTIVVGSPRQSYNEIGSGLSYHAGAVFVYTRSGGVWTQQQKIVPTGTNARYNYDYFGTSVKISSDTLVASSPYQDFDMFGGNSISNAGAAFVFTRNAGVWSQQQKIVPSGLNARIAEDNFGSSIDIDVDTIAVGTYHHSYDEFGGNYLLDAGAAFIFTRSGSVWSQQQKIVPSGVNARLADDYFAYSVAISGETVVIGSYQQDYDATGGNYIINSGAAFVFTRNAGVWSQQQKIVATGLNARSGYGYFGWSVAISNDSIVVGAPYESYDENGNNYVPYPGASFVYTRASSVWSQQQKLVATGSNSRNSYDYFASAVAISGDTIACGSPLQDYDSLGNNYITDTGAAYSFSRALGSWTPQQKIISDLSVPPSRSDLVNGQYGNSTDISEDGNTMIIGAPYDHTDENGLNYKYRSGAVYIYVKNGSGWTLQQKIVPSGVNARNPEDFFGYNVSISNETIAVGAYQQDYDASGGDMRNEAGAVFIFTRSGSSWSQQQKIVATGTNARYYYDNFGKSLALYNDSLVVGSLYNPYDETGSNYVGGAGAAYVFTRTGGVWTQQQKLIPSGANARIIYDYFGTKVDIYNDTIAVSSTNHKYDAIGSNPLDNAGAVFVFTRSGSVWSQQQKIVATGTNARQMDDNFGTSLSLHGETLLVGSPYHDYDSVGGGLMVNAGAAFVFTRTAGVWSLQQKIVATGTNARTTSNYFGMGVGLANDTILIGSPYQSYDETGANFVSSAGAAFVFTRSLGLWTQQIKLVPKGTNARKSSDAFGYNVSLSDNGAADGYTFCIQAPYQDYDTLGNNPFDNTGAVFTFH